MLIVKSFCTVLDFISSEVQYVLEFPKFDNIWLSNLRKELSFNIMLTFHTVSVIYSFSHLYLLLIFWDFRQDRIHYYIQILLFGRVYLGSKMKYIAMTFSVYIIDFNWNLPLFFIRTPGNNYCPCTVMVHLSYCT